MNLKHTSMVVVTLLWAGMVNAGETLQSPNFYQCSGRGANLTLSIGSKAEVGIMPAETVLSLMLDKQNYSFKEEDITLESTLIGELWEVTLKQVPDSHVKHASVIIPEINLGQQPLHFKSQLVLTKVVTPLAGKSVDGVVNASKYIDLSCDAMMVYY